MGDKVNDSDTYGDYMAIAEMAAHQAEALRELVALRWHSAASRRRYIRERQDAAAGWAMAAEALRREEVN